MMSSINFERGNTPLDNDTGSGSDMFYPRIEAPGDQLPDPNKCNATHSSKYLFYCFTN